MDPEEQTGGEHAKDPDSPDAQPHQSCRLGPDADQRHPVREPDADRVPGGGGQPLSGHHYLFDPASRRPASASSSSSGAFGGSAARPGGGFPGYRSQRRRHAQALDDLDSGGDSRRGGAHGRDVSGRPRHGEHVVLWRDLPQRHVAGVHRLPALTACASRLC